MKTVRPGEHDIQQDEVKIIGKGPFQALGAVRFDDAFNPVGFEKISFKFGDFHIVFND